MYAQTRLSDPSRGSSEAIRHHRLPTSIYKSHAYCTPGGPSASLASDWPSRHTSSPFPFLQVSILMSEDLPLLVEYKIHCLGYLRFFLAPKVDEDDIGSWTSIIGLPMNPKAAVAAGAPAILVDALRAHPTSLRIALFACAALRSIARNSAGQEAAVDAGAPPVLAATLQAHLSSVNVAECACCSLMLISHLPSGQCAAANDVVTSAIVAALQSHVSHAAIAKTACSALRNITSLPVGQQAAVDAGAPAVLLAALRIHAGAAKIVGAATAALHNIALIPAGRQAAVDAGALEVINSVESPSLSSRPATSAALTQLEEPEDSESPALPVSVAATLTARGCAVCDQSAGSTGIASLFSCSRCRSVLYCSESCQRVDWKSRHKFVCGLLIP